MSHRTKMYAAGRALTQNLRPNWGVEGPFQWGTVAAVTSGGGTAPSTVSVYLDNSSSGAGAAITTGLPYINGYQPAVGDVVLIGRMAGAARTQRVVLGPLETANFGMSQSGFLTWKNKYRARAHKSATQSITATEARIQYDVVDWDPNGNFDVTTNVGRYTCPLNGFYRVTGCFRVTTQCEMVLDVIKNGTGFSRLALSGTSGAFVAQGSATVQCVATDYLECWGALPGGNQNVPTGVASLENYMEVEYTGD